MEFLQRHLPRVYQAVQDALNFFTNVTAQIFGAPPNAPQPRDARTNVPIQTPKESEGSPTPEETRANKETSLLTSPPELSRATEENGESGRDRPGDVDYGTREADLRHRKSDPGGRRDLEYNITEGGDIVLHTTEEVTTQSCVIESTEWKNTATIPHDSQSLLNGEEVNPPDHPEPKKEIQKSLTACEIKVSQYEEELPPGTENLANNEPLRSSEHKAYKEEEPIGEPSSGGQYDENLFQSAELKSWGQVAAITDQEGKTKRLIEISTESEEYIMNTEREARVLVESTGSTVTPEYDVDNILDVIDINKKLVTPVDETESSPYPQGGDSQKTWEDLLETANRLAKHYDYAVEDQKGSGNLPDIGKTPGSIPVLVLSKGQDLTSVDDSLAMDSFVIERKGQEVETVKAKSRLLEQSVFSGESNNGSSEEEKDMSIRDVDVPRDTTDKENVQRMREHTAEGIEQRHKSKETESQPNISKTQRTKRRVHFSPSTEDFFKKSERVSRKTLQEVCDDILEGEGQPSGEDAEQFGRSYKIEDWGPEEGDRDHHGGTTFSHDEGQSLKEEGEGDNHGGTSYSHNEGLSPKEEGEGDHHRGTSYSHNDGQSLKKEREGNHHGGTSYSHNEGQSLKEEGEGDHHVGISCSHDEGQSPKEEGEGDHHRGTSYSHNEGQSLKEEGEGDHHGGTSCSHDEGQSTSEKEQADVIDEGRAVWYDEDRAQAEHNERCESLGDVTYQGEFKMAESLLAVMDSKSTEEHLDHILSCEEMPLGETESAGNMDASKSKNIICELSVENKNESYASQETINNSEKESQTASDGKEENASEEDSLLQEAKGKEDHLLEERGDILELGTAYEDDFNQSIATLDPKDDGPPKDFMDEQEQVQNLLLEPGIPADDTNEKQLEIISNYSAHKDTIEFTSDELSLQETDKSIKSDQDGTKVQEDFLKSFQEEVAPSIVQLEEHTLLRQPASRNSDDEVPENKYESQLSTSVEDTCISVVENVISRDVLESEEHKEVLRDAHYQGEDEPFNQTHTHKVEEQINENYDYKHEGMRIKTTSRSESQDEDSKVKIGHIKEELLTEQQCVAQEQYVAGNEVSPTEGLINKQMQDVELPGQLVPTHGSEEGPEESYETEQSASQNEVCTSIVQDVLIREGLGSEEYSGIFKDANFEAQSESLNETTTCKVKGHTGVKQNNGYTPHDAIQVDTRESQEEDSKIKTGHTKDECLNGEQFEAEEQLAVHGEESAVELSSNGQFEAEEQLAVHSEESTTELSSIDLFKIEEQLAVHGEESAIELSINDQFEAEEQLTVHVEESAVELSSIDQFEAVEQLAVHSEESAVELFSNDQFEAEEQLAVQSEESTIELSSNDQFEVEEQLAAHDEESTIELSSNDQFEVEEQLAVHDEESTIDISCKAQFEVEEQLEVHSEESTTEVSSNGQFEVERQLANHGEESTIELSSNDQCEVEEQLSRHSDESITELLSNDQFEAEEQLAVHGEESTIELSSNNQFEAEEQLAVHSEETTIELSSNDQFEAEEQLAVHSEESTIESSSNDQFEAKEQLAVHGEESAVELSSNDQFEAEEQLAVHGEESTIELSSNNQFEAEEQLAVNSEETTIELSSNDQFEAEEQLAVQSEESTIEVSSNDQFEVEEQLAVHSEESTIESSSSDQFEAKEQLVVHSEESTIESSSNDQFEAKEQLAVHGEESAVELSSNGQFEAEEQLAVHSDESAVELSSNDQFEAEEQLAVHSEESAIELSSNDRLQEDRLRGQPVIRDSDKVGYRELNETEQSTSLVEMCTSIVEDMRKREDGASKEMNFETESESAKEIITYEVLEPMTLNQNDDYTHDHSQPDAKELHEEDIEVNIGHIEVTFLTQEQVVYTSEIIPAEGLENEQTQEDMSLRQPVPGENDEVCPENLAEEQLVAEEQLKDLNQASLIEGSSIDQPQEHGLLQTVSIQSVELKNEELYGTEQSASIVKICSSMVDDILRETLGSEELSGSITNTNFKADSESNYESAAHDDYTHEDFQPVTNVSQDEESATHDVQEHPAVKINNDYTHGDFQPETNKSQEGESTTRDVQEHPAVKINDYTHGDFQPETNESQEGESATRDVQEHSAVKINNDYTCEDFKPETNESQDKINNSKACHTDIGLLPEEQFVVTDETCQVEGSSNDQQQEDRISEEHNEDFTDINLKRGSKSDSNMFTCEVEEHTAEEQIDNYSYETFHIETNEPQEDYNKANIGSIEVEPKEQMVVEEQLVLKNEASPKDETGDHTEENTNDTYIKDSEEPQLEQYYLKLIKEGYEERESYQQVTDAAQYADTGHTNILETTTEKEDQLDSGSEIHSIIYSSLLDQSVSMSSEGPVDGLDRASMAQNSDNEMGSELYPSHTAASNVDTVVEVTKIADLDVEKVPLFHEEQDLLSEIQCLLSPDHTIHRFPEIMADLDSNGKVTVPLEDQSGAYIEENAPENTKDLNSPLGSHLEGQSDNKDMNWRSTSHSDDVTNRDILLEIQSVVTTEHTTNFVTGVNLESDVRVEEGVGEKAEAESYLTLGHSVPEEYITLETFMEEEQVNNEQKVTSIEPPGFTHEPSQVQSEVNQQDLDFGTLVINTGLLQEVANLGSIRTSAEGELSLTSELCEAEIDIESLTEPANIQQEVDIAREVQSSTNEETTKIYLNDVGHENIEYGIKEENLPIIQTSRYEDIMRDQWQLLNDEMGMSNERAVQEKDDKGMSKEQAMQEEDDKGMSNEQAMQEEDDKGMSNERVVQEEDDKGMSNERAVQEQDDKGMSNEQAVQEEDDKGMSNERVVQEEDDKGMSNERAVQEEDDKGMSNERAVQEEDDKEVSNEQAVQEEDDKEMSNERAVQGEDDKGMSNERVVQEQDGKGMFNERAVQEEDDKEMSIERAVQEQDDKEMSNEPVVQEEDDKGRSNERAVQEEDDKGMSNERAVQEEDDKGMSNERSVQEEDDKGMSNERTVQEEDDEGMSNEQAVQEEDGKGMSNERAVQEEDDKGMSNERAVQEGDDKGMSNERVIKEEDDKGMSNERAVQEEDELDSKVPFHGTLDVSAQKSRILLLRKTSVRRRPGQRPVTFQDELPDPSPPAIPPQNMGVPVFSALPPAVPSAVETLYPAEEPMEANDAPEPIFRRKSTIRRRGPRPVTFQEELTEPLMPGITSASTEEPKDDGTTSEQISSRESLIPPHQGQIPVTFEGKPVEPSPPVIKPLKMGVPDFIGGMPMLSPAVVPDPETSYAAEEPRDEGTTSEPLLRRKSSIRRPKGKQSVKSEDKMVEPPGSVRMGVPLLPGVPEHVTPAPASSQPVEEPKEEKSASEELAIKPKKGFLKHAGFGGAHPGMMQELQARLHKKKPKE